MDEFNVTPEPDRQEPPNTENEHIVGQTGETEPLISPIAAAFIGLIGGFILYQFGGALLTILIFGFDIEAAPVNGLRLLTIAGQLLFLLLPALLFTSWIYRKVSSIIYIRIPKLSEIAIFTLGILILTPMLQSYLYIQNYFINQLAQSSSLINSVKILMDKLNELIEKTFGNILRADNLPEILLVVTAVAIIPAICEEVMFRGFIQRSFEQKLKPFMAALITAIFFSLYHFNPYGILPLMILGLYFGFAAYTSKTLLIPILLHFINNFAAVMLYIIIGDDELISSNVVDPEALSSSVIYFFILMLLFIGVIFLIKRFYSRTKMVQV
ncbi:MAG TPA: CPBP family intramembrane glutamic endopeptidase [Ignavibacteriaceae bacterium]